MISSLALTYAKSLFDPSQLKRMEKVLLELREIQKALGPHKEVFSSPFYSVEEKSAMFEAVLATKVDELVLNLLKLIVKTGRTDLLESIEKAFEQLLDQATGVTRGVVYSSHVLNESEREKIEISLMQLTKKSNVILRYETDPELIGGVIAKVGGMVFDSSLKTYLKNVSQVAVSRTV